MPAGHVFGRGRGICSLTVQEEGNDPPVNVPEDLQHRRLRRHQVKWRRSRGHAPQVLPWAHRCTEDFKLRKKKNDELKPEAKGRGEIISTKRQPEGPKPGFMVEGATLETVTPNRMMLSMILRVATRLTYVFLSFGYVL
ncbi:hypothetical protein C3L33_04091, partial [Rhododendron williamsianum]